MRQEVIELLEEKINNLKKTAMPNDVATGMTGSFFRFNYSILSHEVMTKQEFDDCVYDEYLQNRHKQVYEEINKQPW